MQRPILAAMLLLALLQPLRAAAVDCDATPNVPECLPPPDAHAYCKVYPDAPQCRRPPPPAPDCRTDPSGCRR